MQHLVPYRLYIYQASSAYPDWISLFYSIFQFLLYLVESMFPALHILVLPIFSIPGMLYTVFSEIVSHPPYDLILKSVFHISLPSVIIDTKHHSAASNNFQFLTWVQPLSLYIWRSLSWIFLSWRPAHSLLYPCREQHIHAFAYIR